MLTRREIALLSTLIHRHIATIKRRSSEDEAEWEFRLNGFEELAEKLKGMYDAPKNMARRDKTDEWDATHPSLDKNAALATPSPQEQMDALNEPKAGDQAPHQNDEPCFPAERE